MEHKEGQQIVEGLSVEIQELLKRKGLRSEDFMEWLGTQRQNGSDLKNWTHEELSRKVAYYCEVYGVKPVNSITNSQTTAANPSLVKESPDPNLVVTESGHSQDSSISDHEHHAVPGGRDYTGEAIASPFTTNSSNIQGSTENAASQPVQNVRLEK
jgi:hypothetical protein